ncbi:MAG: DUF4974 domain-containing protein [Bacteroidetes bacterium]|nr:DUF4974 domain-containing protein [Bacteroidota bacterium]
MQHWISDSPENLKYFNEVCDIWTAYGEHLHNDYDPLEALDKVRNRLGGFLENKEKKARGLTGLWLKVAAFILALIAVGWLSYYAGNRQTGLTPEITEIESPMGSRTKVNLPDGTKVWLNGGSMLKFSSRFNKSDRIVSITGEGYFDVMHRKELPFVVNTHEIRIKVLGTTFNIKAYPDDGSIETTLERGSLSIEKMSSGGTSMPQTILAPNQRATYIKMNGKVHLSEEDKKATMNNSPDPIKPLREKLLISKRIDTQVYTSWKENKLVFRNEPFESLILKLERWYGVNIIVKDDEINNYH